MQLLQLYDRNHNKVRGLKAYKDLKIESTLKTSDKIFSISYPQILSKSIENEGYIRTKEQEYVIKEIREGNEWNDIIAILNLEELEGNPIQNFDSTEKTITECMQLAIAGSGYTVELKDNITKKRTVRKTNTNSLDILTDIKETYIVEMEFDTINKKILVYEKLGSDKGAYFIDSLNLKKLEVNNDSYDFCTRIIAVGATDEATKKTLTVTVTNNQYSNKVKTLLWKDERYTVEASLREDATYKLNELSKPKTSYGATVYDLANMNLIYKNILAYGLGDTITLIDKIKGIKDKQRIVKIIEYPYEPEKNTVELSNTMLTFEDVLKGQKKAEDTVSNITSDNGTISQDALRSTLLTLINVNMQNLSAVSARIGELFTNQLQADVANISTGIVGRLLAQKAEITDLTASKLKFDIAEGGDMSLLDLLTKFLSANSTETLHLTAGNVVIDDAVIKSAMIDFITADKMTAGTINADKVNLLAEKDGYKLAQTGRLFQWYKMIDGVYVLIAQEGFDANNKFSFCIKDETGTFTKYDETGITEHAVPDGLIVNSMVADDANIDGKKVNIASLITEINNGNKKIDASTIVMDGTTQTFEVAFKEINETLNNLNVENKNLISYNIDNWEQGGINASTGVEGDSLYYIRSIEYIPVESGKYYTITKYDNNNFDLYILVYDSDKAFVRGPGLVNDMTYTTSFDIGYVRFMVRKKITTPQSTITVNELKNYKFKFEVGSASSEFSYNPTDLGNTTVTLQTDVKAVQGDIETLTKNTTVIVDGQNKLLKDDYTQTKQTVGELGGSINSLQTTVNGIDTNNLLRYSGGDYKDVSKWQKANFITNDTFIIESTGYYRIYNTTSKLIFVTNAAPINAPSDKNISIAFDYYCNDINNTLNGITKISFYILQELNNSNNFYDTYTKIELTKSLSVKHYEGTLKLNANCTRFMIRFDITTNSTTAAAFRFKDITINAGTIPMKIWSPCHLDVGADINSIKQRTTSAEAKLKDSALTLTFQKNQNRIFNIRYIRDYCNANTKNGGCHWMDIQAIDNLGNNLALNKTATVTSNVTLTNPDYTIDGIHNDFSKYTECSNNADKVPYVQIYLGGLYSNIDEIKVWHYYGDGRSYNSTRTDVSADGVNWITLFDSAVSGQYVESEYGHSIKVNGTSFNMSKIIGNELGLHVKNGAIDISNNAGVKVLDADTNGNLRFTGIVEQRDYSTGYLATALKYNGLLTFDWRRKDDLVGGIVSTEDDSSKRGGISIFSDKGNLLNLCYRTSGTEGDFSDTSFSTVMQIDDTKTAEPGYVTTFYKEMAFKNEPVFLYNTYHQANVKIRDYYNLELFGNDYNIPMGTLGCTDNNNVWLACNSTLNTVVRLGARNNGGGTYTPYFQADSGGATAYGNLACTGTKLRLVKTKDYGYVGQNAYETAECYFGDLIFIVTDDKGYCKVVFDKKFLQTVNTRCRYHVILSAYGGDDDVFPVAKTIEETETYFIVKSNVPNTEFSVQVSCKQLGYEDHRLVEHKLETEEGE